MRLEQVRKFGMRLAGTPTCLNRSQNQKECAGGRSCGFEPGRKRPRSVPIPASSLITDIDLGTISDRSPGTIGTGYVSSERGTVLTPIDTENRPSWKPLGHSSRAAR